jgi:adenylate cyclase
MGLEIERKFRVIGDSWRENAESVHIRQGYLAIGPPVSVRVRVTGSSAMLNIKESTLEIARAEFEYEIPVAEAREMLEDLCEGGIVEKNRYTIDFEGCRWEIDEFLGDNQGLLIAEIELEGVDQTFPRPPRLGAEVSGDERYFNTFLSRNPYCDWLEK